MSKAPQIAQPPNNTPEPSMAYRYERAHKQLFEKLSEGMQARVMTVKANPTLKDVEVNEFVSQVIALAESEQEL